MANMTVFVVNNGGRGVSERVTLATGGTVADALAAKGYSSSNTTLRS